MSKFIDKLLGKKEFDFQGNITQLKDKSSSMFDFPMELANPLIDFMLERDYLEDVSEISLFSEIPNSNLRKNIKWIRIDRLPVSPLRIESYDLLSRWQGVLAALHSWNQRVVFMLRRQNGKTNIYLGVTAKAVNDCTVALENSMPGVGITELTVLWLSD